VPGWALLVVGWERCVVGWARWVVEMGELGMLGVLVLCRVEGPSAACEWHKRFDAGGADVWQAACLTWA
jgi:hypothetical protein